MAGGNKYIIDKESGSVFAITDTTEAGQAAATLPSDKAIIECERIRSYLRERWGYNDTPSLSEVVVHLLGMIETRDLAPKTEGEGNGG